VHMQIVKLLREEQIVNE